jgi:predicted DNA-binding protein YlxM (UPF0122 family)
VGRIKYKEVAGLEVKRGRPVKANKPSKSELNRLYVKESKSIREIADILNCSKDMVYRSLKEYGINTRTRGLGKKRQSRLSKYKIDTLEEGIKEKGLRGYAKELGVHENTLRHYIKKAREED